MLFRDYLANIFNKISKSLGVNNSKEAISLFRDIMSQISLQKPISDNLNSDILTLSNSVNSVRLRNNPVELGKDVIYFLYSCIIE